jgi:hypothetical protein
MMKLAKHVKYRDETKRAYEILIGKSKGRCHLGDLRSDEKITL